MKNFKKVISLTLALVMVLSTMTTAFAAADTEAATLNKLGLFEGTSKEAYVPDLDLEANAPTALVLIGRALGWEVDMTATTTFEDVPTWAAPYVAYAVDAGITNGVSATEFGADLIDGKRVTTWLLRALGYDNQEAWDKTDELAATAGITVPTATPILRGDMVGVIYEALMLTPVDGALSLIEAIILGDAAKTAIAEEAGFVSSTLSIVSAGVTGVETVEVELNKAVDTTKTVVQVKKGAAIYSSAVVWNDSMNAATVTTVIELPDGNYTAVVTVDGGTPIVKAFVVADEAAATIVVTDNVLYDELGAAEVAFVVNNQYGEDMEVDADEVTVVAYNVTQNASVAVGQPADAFFTVNTLDDGASTPVLTPDDFELNDVVRFTVSYLGMTTQATLTVLDAASSDVIVLGDLVLTEEDAVKLSVGDSDPELNYTLLDQYGEEVELGATTYVAGTALIDGVTFVSSDTDVIAGFYVEEDADNDDEFLLLLKMGTTDGTAVVTAVVNASGTVTTTSIVVTAVPVADAVAVAAPTMLVAAGDDAFDLDVTITDQFGDVVTDDAGVTYTFDFDGTVDTESVVFTPSDADDKTILNVDLSSAVITEDNETTELTITANFDGEEVGTVSFDVEPNAAASDVKAASFATVFELSTSTGAALTIDNDDLTVVDQYGRDFEGTITLASDDASLVAAGTTMTAISVGTATVTVTVDGKELDVDVEVIVTDDIDSYAMSEVGLLFVAADAATPADYVVTVEVDGVYNGDKVALVNVAPDVVTSSDEAIITVAGADVTGFDAGTSTISVWMDGTKIDSETVTVSDAAPYAVSVVWDETTIATATDLSTIIIVKDQYGVEVDVTLYYSSDDHTIVGNKIAATGTGEIKVITSNGLTATETITVE